MLRMPGATHTLRRGVLSSLLCALVCVVDGGSAWAQSFEVAINEVHYHPGDGLTDSEFIEIHNYGAERADLDGWFLVGGVEFIFPSFSRIPAGGYLLVANSKAALLERYEIEPALIAGEYDGSLDNGGEALRLFSPDGYLVSFVEYSDADPFPETPDGLGPSLERRSPFFEEADPQAWAASILVGGTPGSRNTVFAPESVPQPPGEELEIIAPGAQWRFFRGTEEPPADWRDVDFDDAGWPSGPSGFGYGDGDDATVIDDMQGSYLTLFIRRSFEVDDPSAVSDLSLEIDYDDGFVACINGVEVARSNVSSRAYDAPATEGHEAGTPETFAIARPAEILLEGENVLAIQGHNASVTSGDFSLMPSLRGIFVDPGEDPPDDPPLPEPPARDLVINELSPGGPWTGWLELHNPTDAAVDASSRRLLLWPASLGDHEIAPGSIIAPRGHLVLGEAELGFELDGIATVILATGDGRYIDAMNPRTTDGGHSTGRYPDGSDNRFVFTSPTPELPNDPPAAHAVVINEIMYRPAQGGPDVEFVELHNASDEAADCSGWSFTRGVSYTFAAGTVIPAGGYAVIASDPAAVEAHYGISGALGPYEGRLNNDAETLLLRDALGNPVDRVRYADEGSWPEEPDGDGPSAELVHPRLDNRHGAAWAASEGEGTPGAPNSRFEDDPPPAIAGVEHSPVIPTSGDSVRVLASISDERSIVRATLWYLRDGSGGAPQAVAMADDGIADDGAAGNGIYGGEIPPHADLRVVAFWIEAEAEGGETSTAPAGYPGRTFLYQVEDLELQEPRPVYRIIMTAQNLNELRTRSVYSDVLLDATFVAGGKAYYNRGIRNRGQSARRCDPLSYRIQFDHDVDLHGIKRLNVNGCNTERQWIGLEFLRRAGIPTPSAWFRRLAFNAQIAGGMFLRVEAIDDQFLERAFPGDADGNLYRGVSQANLDYRGETFGSYRSNYVKITNEKEADWSDVVDICYRFDTDTTSDGDFPAAIEERVDVLEWSLYFAVFALLGTTENSILLGNGDDYFIYHRYSDDRWVILPWDLDSVFNDVNQVLFRPTVDAIERFLEHPRYASDYWCFLEHLLEGAFLPERIQRSIDHLVPLFPPARIQALRDYVPARREYILSRLRRDLTVDLAGAGMICDGVFVPAEPALLLEGTAAGCGTAEILVNAEPAGYDSISGEWDAMVDLTGATRLEIIAVDRSGVETARLEIPVAGTVQPTPLPESVTGSLTLVRDESPYLAAGDVTVEPGATLAVEPGVMLILEQDATLRVAGTLQALGTEREPIRFTPEICGSSWEGIVFLPGSAPSELRHCEIHGLSGAGGYSAALVIDEGGDLLLSSVSLDESSAPLLLVREGGRAQMLGGVFASAPAGIVIDGGEVESTGTIFRDIAGAAISSPVGAAAGSLELSRAEVFACGEGITGALAATVSGGLLHDIAGTAISLAGSYSIIERSIIWSCGSGVAAADGALVTLRHVTIHGVGTGVRLAEETAGKGGGEMLIESSILWEAAAPLDVDAASAAEIRYCDVAGGVLEGAGNISADPLFRDAAGADFRLRAPSPCRERAMDGEDMGAIPYEPSGTLNRFLRCDSSGDDSLDISDAIHTLLALFAGGDAAPCAIAADCNGDRVVNLSDAVFHLSLLFLGGAPPPGPYPDCDTAEAEECAVDTCVR